MKKIKLFLILCLALILGIGAGILFDNYNTSKNNTVQELDNNIDTTGNDEE